MLLHIIFIELESWNEHRTVFMTTAGVRTCLQYPVTLSAEETGRLEHELFGEIKVFL